MNEYPQIEERNTLAYPQFAGFLLLKGGYTDKKEGVLYERVCGRAYKNIT